MSHFTTFSQNGVSYGKSQLLNVANFGDVIFGANEKMRHFGDFQTMC